MSVKKLSVALVAALVLSASAASAQDATFNATRVTVESGKSFEAVVEAVKSLVAKSGMMVMGEVNQGQMLSMAGLKLKATLFLVGNPNVGKQIFEQEHAAGLYIPLRVFVYEDGGKTFVSYDKPSSLLGQFGNDKVKNVGEMLDQNIGNLATMAAR